MSFFYVYTAHWVNTKDKILRWGAKAQKAIYPMYVFV